MNMDRFQPPSRRDDMACCQGCQAEMHYTLLSDDGFCEECSSPQEAKEPMSNQEHKPETAGADCSPAPCSVRTWPRYRIVTDNHLGFEVQVRQSWWRFWTQCAGPKNNVCNTFATLKAAREWAHTKPAPQFFVRRACVVVEEVAPNAKLRPAEPKP